MNKFTGKFEKLHEETLYRHQQGGFLRGDYAKIKKGALKDERVAHFSEQLKSIIQDAIKNETTLRVSYIKSGRSEAFSGPVDAANIPSCELWADCYEEYAPGMWNNIMTLPLSILEKIEMEGAEGYAPYNKKLVRPNAEAPGKEDNVLKDQTKGDDENRKMSKKNTKLAHTKEPKDGRKQTPFKEGAGFSKENDFIFESYLKAQMMLVEEEDPQAEEGSNGNGGSVNNPPSEEPYTQEPGEDITVDDMIAKLKELKAQGNEEEATHILQNIAKTNPSLYKQLRLKIIKNVHANMKTR